MFDRALNTPDVSRDSQKENIYVSYQKRKMLFLV